MSDPETKPKKELSPEQLERLARARERALEVRKQNAQARKEQKELKELETKKENEERTKKLKKLKEPEPIREEIIEDEEEEEEEIIKPVKVKPVKQNIKVKPKPRKKVIYYDSSSSDDDHVVYKNRKPEVREPRFTQRELDEMKELEQEKTRLIRNIFPHYQK